MVDKRVFLSEIRMRRADESDCIDVFRWRNDPETRKNSVGGTEAVPFQNHKKWFVARLIDPDTRIYIGLYRKNKVGLMRFDIGPRHIIVTTNINPKFRGMGVGTRIMALTTGDIFRKFKRPIRAIIKNFNIASIRMCEKNGYRITRRTRDVTYMRYDGARVAER